MVREPSCASAVIMFLVGLLIQEDRVYTCNGIYTKDTSVLSVFKSSLVHYAFLSFCLPLQG